jgi:hypothetical protein
MSWHNFCVLPIEEPELRAAQFEAKPEKETAV